MQTGGSAGDSKYVTGQTSANYNSGGYSGTLTRYLHSGSYTPGTPYEVTWYTGYCYNENGMRQGFDSPTIPCGVNGGYHTETHIDRTYTKTQYTGGSDTRVYHYEGTVYKPDTRTYRTDYTSNYSGTVYKAGVDNYYSYEVTLEYIDNTVPEILIIDPDTLQTINKDGSITISGTIDDPDEDTITIFASIGEVEKTFKITGPVANEPWTLSWTGEELTEEEYIDVTLTANDNEGGEGTTTYKGKIIVDKTAPEIKISVGN